MRLWHQNMNGKDGAAVNFLLSFFTFSQHAKREGVIRNLFIISCWESYAAHRSKVIFSGWYFKEEPDDVPTFSLRYCQKLQAWFWRVWSFPLQVLNGGLKQLFLYINIIWIDCTFKFGSFCDEFFDTFKKRPVTAACANAMIAVRLTCLLIVLWTFWGSFMVSYVLITTVKLKQHR